MAITKLDVFKYRLQMFAWDLRIFLFNFWYGWTTDDQRWAAHSAGIESFYTGEECQYSHPLLQEFYDDGVQNAHDCELDAHEYEDTYAMIGREEMSDLYDECYELGLV